MIEVGEPSESQVMRHRLAGAAALSILALGIAPSVGAQTFSIVFEKLSAGDDSVEDVLTGFPPSRDCPAPCTEAHFVCRIANCQSVDAAGACLDANPGPVTGGLFTDTPPITLPLDCARGVTLTGTGSWDPPVCDVATNTVTVANMTVPPGETVTVSFWAAVDCDEGVPINHAFFEYDQNPLPTPDDAHDPVSFFGADGLAFRVGNVSSAESTKDAPDLPVMGMPARRIGQWGLRTPWVIQGGNANCEPMTILSLWDEPTPAGCLTVDCATLRMFINDVPTALPLGSLCPDAARPAPFSLGSFTLDPHDRVRLTFDAVFTSDTLVEECCNMGLIDVMGTPLVTTSDPRLDTGLMPEQTCATLNFAVGTQLDAVKAAEDAAGNPIAAVRPGDDIYWRFTITNQGGTDLAFDLSDDFPASAQLSPGSIVTPFATGTCVIAGQTLSCTGVALPASSTAVMLVRTALDCTGLQGGDRICNEGTITAAGLPMPVATRCPTCAPMAPGNRTCVTLEAPAFSSASKSATDAGGDGRVSVGEVVSYRITPLNTGTAAATGVVVRDVVPAGASYVLGSLQLDGVPLTDAADADAGEVAGGNVAVRVGNVAVLAFGTGVVGFDVRLDAQAGAQLCNAGATVEWAEAMLCGGGPQPIPPACLDFEPAPPQPQITAVKSVVPGGSVDPGALVQYSIGVCNGPLAAAATGVTLVDDVPAGTTYVANSLTLDGGGVSDPADGDPGEFQALPVPRILVTVGALAPGECRTVAFEATVNAGAMGAVSNLAQVSADGVTPFDSNTVTTPVRPPTPPQISIAKSSVVAGGPPATVGATIAYALNVCNAAGAGEATNVQVVDAIPFDAATLCAGTYVTGSITVDGAPRTDAPDADGARFEALPAPGGVVVDLARLLPGECARVAFEVVVAPGCDDGEVVSNAATAAAAGVAPITSNATSDIVSVIVPPAPALLRKEGFPLANRCPAPPLRCGCEVGPRLDPVADDCVTAGTCSQVDASTWTVPNDLNVHVPLVFYELLGAGCVRLGDPTRLAVTKSLPDDVTVSLVP